MDSAPVRSSIDCRVLLGLMIYIANTYDALCGYNRKN